MNITDIAVILVIALILGGAAGFVYRSKKNEKKCIGCPDNCACSGGCTGCKEQ